MKLEKALQYRIIVPPFFLFLIVVVISIIIGGNFFHSQINNRYIKQFHNELLRRQAYEKRTLDNMLNVASLLASKNTIKENFSHNALNLRDTCKIFFNKELKYLDSNFNMDINFYFPDGEWIYANRDRIKFTDKNIRSLKNVVELNQREIIKGMYSGQLILGVLYPVISENKVVGIVLVSLPFKKVVSQYYLSDNEEIILCDNWGEIIYHSPFKGKNIKKIKAKIRTASDSSFSFENYKIFSIPIKGSSHENIAKLFFFTDRTQDQIFISELLRYSLLFSLLAFVIGGFIYWYGMNKTVIKPISVMRDKILKIAKGELVDKFTVVKNHVLKEILDAVNILIRNQQDTAEFATEIGHGKFDKNFTPLSENDILGNALLEMRNNLLRAKEAEGKRQQEDKQRQWMAEGLAKFGEILRQNNDDIQKLSDEIIRELVHYVGAVQGGIFVVNDNNKEEVVLDMISAYAYDRKKFMEKQVKLGEGLVGTCAIEKLPIYMTDVPDNYVQITSGLGKANPTSILLTPLKMEDKIFGVIELAGFKEFEPYKREFVEKLSESIGATLNAVKINIKTSYLLEQSQQQAEELAAQEEEMRQNMEELQATQEEAYRREQELNNIVGAIDGSFVRMEVNLEGQIIFSNKKTREVLLFSENEIKGKDIITLIDSNQHTEFKTLWNSVINGIYKGGIFNVLDKEGHFIESYLVLSPVLNETGNVKKVIIVQNILI